jgi:hypothetical protein
LITGEQSIAGKEFARSSLSYSHRYLGHSTEQTYISAVGDPRDFSSTLSLQGFHKVTFQIQRIETARFF